MTVPVTIKHEKRREADPLSDPRTCDPFQGKPSRNQSWRRCSGAPWTRRTSARAWSSSATHLRLPIPSWPQTGLCEVPGRGSSALLAARKLGRKDCFRHSNGSSSTTPQRCSGVLGEDPAGKQHLSVRELHRKQGSVFAVMLSFTDTTNLWLCMQ
jgi:hypothetical protein